MSRYGSVNTAAPSLTRVVQAAAPDLLASAILAAVTELFTAGATVIVDMTLAGGGDGHTFTVTIEAAAPQNVLGGLTLFGGVRCYLASEAEALLVAHAAAGALPPEAPLADSQVAGASKGTRFMGLLVYGTVDNGSVPVVVPAFKFAWAGMQPEDFYTTPPALNFLLPKDGITPLLCVIDPVSPGNVIECAIALIAGEANANPGGLIYQMNATLIASFEPAPVFPADYVPMPSGGGTTGFKVRSTDTGGGTVSGFGNMSTWGAITVPPGKTKVTIGIDASIIADPGITDLGIVSAIIRAAELPAAYVPAPP
jgi:hypothetical protein